MNGKSATASRVGPWSSLSVHSRNASIWMSITTGIRWIVAHELVSRIKLAATLALAAFALAAAVGGTSVLADHLTGSPATYTLDADFDEGSLINVVHDPRDQLQLDDTTEAFNFVRISVSSKGTIVEIDTQTGVVLGEYSTNPDHLAAPNNSRTTVDANGNVWATNRNASIYVTAGALGVDGNGASIPLVNRYMGSVVRVGLAENGQCDDRKNSGTIETSTGLGDVKPWPNGGGGGAVDLTTVNLGGYLYDYSDTSGSTLSAAPDAGTWEIIQDVGVVGAEWGTVSWIPANPATARSA